MKTVKTTLLLSSTRNLLVVKVMSGELDDSKLDIAIPGGVAC